MYCIILDWLIITFLLFRWILILNKYGCLTCLFFCSSSLSQAFDLHCFYLEACLTLICCDFISCDISLTLTAVSAVLNWMNI